MKRVLIVTYYWPPAGGGGVQRVAKFAKYLPRFGWEPVILTVAGGNFPHRDASLEADVRGIRAVHRIPTREPHALYQRLFRRSPAPGESHGEEALSRHNRLAEWIRLNVFVPDSRIGWRAPAAARARALVAELSPSVIFSSAPPYTSHLVALDVKKKSGLPWVADFRDPWVENFTYNTVPRLGVVRALNRRMEHQVLATADRVLSVGNHLSQLLQQKLPAGDRAKCRLISNGYDPADIPRAPDTSSGTFTLAYYGTMYRNGFPLELFDALRDVLTGPGPLARDLHVRLVGKIDADLYRRFQAVVPAARLSLQGYLPHETMLREAHAPQVLLMIINRMPHERLVLTGKLFDYLPTGNPIVAIGPADGDAAAVLRETGAGRIVSPDDMAAFREALNAAHHDWQSGRLNQGIRSVPAYSREHQAGQLAALFEELTP